MKVVVAGTRGIPRIMGGVETHCEHLFPRLVELGCDVTIIRRKPYVIEDNQETEYKGVKLVDLYAPRSKALEAAVHTMLAVVRARRLHADVLHIHAIGPCLAVPLARLLGLRVVITNHGPDYDREKWGRLAKAVLRLGERWGVRYANEVIVISQVIKELIANKYGRRDSHLIYNGVPQPQMVDFPEYFQQLGIEPGKYLLSACRLVPEKNMHHVLQAWRQLNTGDMKLVIAGDDNSEYARQLKEEARKAGVVLTGFVRGRHLWSLLTHARAYLLPSSHEGLPIALLEAMSYRLPVIVSDIPACLEVGLPDSCYFPLGDIDQLRDKMREVLEAPLQRCDYDMTPYDWDHIAQQTLDVYRQLVKE